MGHIEFDMAVSKMTREASNSQQTMDEDDLFDFGEPEVIPVEISPGKFLTLREPSANDLIEIGKITDNKNVGEVEATLQTICILHSPDPGSRKLTLKDAKRLRPKQLRQLGQAMNQLLGLDEGEED
jgi:hypothetical protein